MGLTTTPQLANQLLKGPMVQMVLDILGIIAVVRYRRLRMLSGRDDPGVDKGTLAERLTAEKSAANWFRAATVGEFDVSVALAAPIQLGMSLSHFPSGTISSAAQATDLAIIALFLGMLVVAAMKGSTAAKLKERAGIVSPGG